MAAPGNYARLREQRPANSHLGDVSLRRNLMLYCELRGRSVSDIANPTRVLAAANTLGGRPALCTPPIRLLVQTVKPNPTLIPFVL